MSGVGSWRGRRSVANFQKVYYLAGLIVDIAPLQQRERGIPNLTLENGGRGG